MATTRAADDQVTPDVSSTGFWIDNATGRLVVAPPVEGVQLVAPGGEIPTEGPTAELIALHKAKAKVKPK